MKLILFDTEKRKADVITAEKISVSGGIILADDMKLHSVFDYAVVDDDFAPEDKTYEEIKAAHIPQAQTADDMTNIQLAVTELYERMIKAGI